MKLLLPDQDEELKSLQPALAATPEAESAYRLLVTRVAAIIDAPVFLLDVAVHHVDRVPEERFRLAELRMLFPVDYVGLRRFRVSALYEDLFYQVLNVLYRGDPVFLI